MNRFPDTFQTVTDRSLFGPNVPHITNTLTRWLTKFRMRRTGTQLIDPLVHGAPNNYERNVPAIAIRPLCRWGDGPTATSSPLPKLDILAVDDDEEPPEEWEAEDDVKGRSIGPT